MNDKIPHQFHLEIALDDSATFDNFYVSENNAGAIQYLTQAKGASIAQFTFLWGAAGSGRTHLLQALCHETQSQGGSAFYVPLKMASDLAPEILEGLESFDLVCLDDISCVLGDENWEAALFTLFNTLRDADVRLVVSDGASPLTLTAKLKDLQSRLQSGIVFHLHSAEDDDKLQALQLRASRRGFELSDDVARYVLQRNERSMSGLFDFLNRLDQHSLVTQRKITIPLVRDLVSYSEPNVYSGNE